ncbi:MAG: alkaline phosphatase family protein [Armatimonadota bacterium]
MSRAAVLNVVGLTTRCLKSMPRLTRWAQQGAVTPITPVLPAVTCSAQATYLTGTRPAAHGIVGNGWYFREECEIKFWRQSNHLVQAPKLWEIAKEHNSSFTCANLCWWYAMYAGTDITVTPRPMYPADGRKLPDCWTRPADLRDRLQRELGQFPLFHYWGPTASIRSSQWIADAARYVEEQDQPTLSLVYLPHLDYPLQRLGPDDPALLPELRAVDDLCCDLITFYEQQEVSVLVLSEYGITPVQRPVHLNRLLREHGLLAIREELGRELLDAGASAAFAVADHQIAHVYVNNSEKLHLVRALLEATPGVGEVLDASGKAMHHLDHPRAGDLVAVAAPDAWFTYYYWLDNRCAPDFARTVDIHRKPGYDPVELFLDPWIRFPQFTIGMTLLKKHLGFRTLLEVVPLDAGLVRGSHGHRPHEQADWPVLITPLPAALSPAPLEAPTVYSIILQHLGVESVDAQVHTSHVQ